MQMYSDSAAGEGEGEESIGNAVLSVELDILAVFCSFSYYL